MRPTSFQPASLVMASLFLLLAVTVLVAAYAYGGASGLFPRFIGWIFVGLSSAELIIQSQRALIQHRTHLKGNGEVLGASDATVGRKSLEGFLWLALMLMLVCVVGFLAATLIFVFTYLWQSGKKSIVKSTVVAGVTTVSVYLVFAVMLNYELYGGLLFS